MNDARALLRPHLLAVHLFALLAIAVCVVLGLWQLGVYESEQADQQDALASATPVPLTSALGPDAGLTNEFLGAPVTADGQYAPDAQQFLVSDRSRQGRSGYWVVSPLLLDNGSAILVVRGWTPQASAPPVPTTPVTVTGALQPGEEPGVDSLPGPDRIVDSIRIPSLVGVMPFDLYSAVLIRTAEEPKPTDGLAPVDPSAPNVPWTDGLRNLAYGLQWWVFAAFAVFMWWRVCEDLIGRRESPAEVSAEDVSVDKADRRQSRLRTD